MDHRSDLGRGKSTYSPAPSGASASSHDANHYDMSHGRTNEGREMILVGRSSAWSLHPSDNPRRFPILPVGNPHLIDAKYNFLWTALDVFMKIPDCFLKETTRNFEVLGFLRDTFHPT
jgi:hypothetical protein